jgi:hypothetical protein
MAAGAAATARAYQRKNKVVHPSKPSTHRVVAQEATSARGGQGPVRHDKAPAYLRGTP